MSSQLQQWQHVKFHHAASLSRSLVSIISTSPNQDFVDEAMRLMKAKSPEQMHDLILKRLQYVCDPENLIVKGDSGVQADARATGVQPPSPVPVHADSEPLAAPTAASKPINVSPTIRLVGSQVLGQAVHEQSARDDPVIKLSLVGNMEKENAQQASCSDGCDRGSSVQAASSESSSISSSSSRSSSLLHLPSRTDPLLGRWNTRHNRSLASPPHVQYSHPERDSTNSLFDAVESHPLNRSLEFRSQQAAVTQPPEPANAALPPQDMEIESDVLLESEPPPLEPETQVPPEFYELNSLGIW